MASPQPPRDPRTATRERAPAGAFPREAPPLQNPPAVIDPLEDAKRRRAQQAIGGPGRASRASTDQVVVEDTQIAGPSMDSATARGRFTPPQELRFSFTPLARQEIRNNNIPLTVGLLIAILASFVVFLISLSSGTAGDDPIMPSFWRAMGTLAVLITLSFAASWFMPAPIDRRSLLDQLDAEDRLRDERVGREPMDVDEDELATEMADEAEAVAESTKGSSVDYTVADEGDHLPAGYDKDDDDEVFEDEDEDEEEVRSTS